MHLAKNTEFSLQGTRLADQLASETAVKVSDGSHWIALYQRYVHLECTVQFLSWVNLNQQGGCKVG